jgi:small basic protein (TIGR04137 family)
MGLHSSLKRAEKLASTRSVMKRTERLKWLKERGAWKEGDKISGLPKIKVVKLKSVKKEKAKEETPADSTAPAAADASAAKPAAAKPAAAKPAAK